MSVLPLSLLCEQQEEAKREVLLPGEFPGVFSSAVCQELASLSGYLYCPTLGPTSPPSTTADTRHHILKV